MSDDRSHARIFAAIATALATARPIWAILALIAVLAIVAGCALDTERLDAKRAEIQKLCQGAITAPLKALCERYGIDTRSDLEVK